MQKRPFNDLLDSRMDLLSRKKKSPSYDSFTTSSLRPIPLPRLDDTPKKILMTEQQKTTTKTTKTIDITKNCMATQKHTYEKKTMTQHKKKKTKKNATATCTFIQKKTYRKKKN